VHAALEVIVLTFSADKLATARHFAVPHFQTGPRLVVHQVQNESLQLHKRLLLCSVLQVDVCWTKNKNKI